MCVLLEVKQEETCPKDDVARYRENRQDEINSAALYRTLAALEPQTQLSQIYERLATVEERHARFWERHLRAAGESVPPPRPSWRARVLIWLAKRLGPQWVLPTVATSERVGRHMYDRQPEAQNTMLPVDERSTHASSAPSSARQVSRATRWPALKGATGPLAGTRSAPLCWGRMTAWSPISAWSWG